MTREFGPAWSEHYRGETDPALLDPYLLDGQDGYERAGVPEPMVPGLQPWQTGEPAGQLVEDDWRTDRFRAGWAEPFEPQDGPGTSGRTCPTCSGHGCGWCAWTGWAP